MATILDMMVITITSLCLNVLVINTRSIPDTDTPRGAEDFFRRYGYASGWGDRTSLTNEEMREAIRKFQQFNHLPATGELDAATKELMQKDRCDLPDFTDTRNPRFAIRDVKWTKNLRWKLTKAEVIPPSEGERVMTEAIQEWQQWMSLITVSQSNDTDSEVLVEYVIPDEDGNHGDGVTFGSNTLAHAFYPGEHPLSGDVHFNMAKRLTWYSYTPLTAYDIKHIAVHELGHSLGLQHSDVNGAVMSPYASIGTSYSQLHSDDILGILALYGKCFESQCQNGGTCTHVATMPGFNCDCTPTYTGTNCEIENKCGADPCQNGGTCTNDAGAPSGYSCNCPVTHIGDNCDQASPCSSDPCQNGGTCSPASNSDGYTCNCTSSYTGTQCTDSKCSSSPCENGGTCSLASNAAGYSCQCSTQYNGDRCEESKCANNPCQNGGTCSLANSMQGYSCTCAATYDGDNCNNINQSNVTAGPSIMNGVAPMSSASYQYTLVTILAMFYLKTLQ